MWWVIKITDTKAHPRNTPKQCERLKAWKGPFAYLPLISMRNRDTPDTVPTFDSRVQLVYDLTRVYRWKQLVLVVAGMSPVPELIRMEMEVYIDRTLLLRDRTLVYIDRQNGGRLAFAACTCTTRWRMCPVETESADKKKVEFLFSKMGKSCGDR